MGEQHRHVIDRVKPLPLQLICEGFGVPSRFHAESRLVDFVTRQIRLPTIANNNKRISDSELMRTDNRAVDFYLIRFCWDRKTVRQFNVGHDEAILLGEFTPHFGNSDRKFTA